MTNPENPTHVKEPAKKGLKGKSHPFWRFFWLTFLLASLGYAWYSYYVPANEIAWAKDFASAQQHAQTSNKNMMLFFTANWCVPCRIMKRQVFADPKVMTAINAQVVPVLIHQEDPSATSVFSQYQVGGTPVTIFTDPQGNVLDYGVGKMAKSEFLAMLSQLKQTGP